MWSGGNYTKGNNATGGWVGDASLGIGIEAGRHDTQDDDFATGINQCLNKDGSNAATGNLNLGGNKLTNIGAATARTDAAQTAQVQDSSPLWGGTSGGTSTAYTITLSPPITAYATGQTFRWIANATVTGAATINVNSVGAKTLQRQGTALVGNEFKTDDVVEMVYDGTQFQITNIASAPIYVDRTNNRVGIGTTAPTSALTTIGNALLAPNTSNTAGDTYYEARNSGTADGSPNFIRVGIDGAVLNGVAYIDARNLGVSNATPLVFRNNGTERMRITSGGNVGIGTTNPTSPLTVGDGTGQKIIVVNGANSGTGGGCAFTWQNGSNPIIAIGNYSGIYGGAYDASPTFYNGTGLAYKVGNMTAAVGTHFMKWHNTTGAWTYDTSSARYKDNIEDSSYGLAEVLAMRPVTFTYKAEPDRHDVGFIAEEMVNVVPEVVAKNTEGEPDAISYDRLTSVLCKAIQELNAKVEALKARIAALEA